MNSLKSNEINRIYACVCVCVCVCVCIHIHMNVICNPVTQFLGSHGQRSIHCTENSIASLKALTLSITFLVRLNTTITTTINRTTNRSGCGSRGKGRHPFLKEKCFATPHSVAVWFCCSPFLIGQSERWWILSHHFFLSVGYMSACYSANSSK
jgi:hypothetical protein